MIRRIRQLFQRAHAWRAAHHAAWPPAKVVGADGFTPFQRECERRLSECLSSRGIRLDHRRLQSARESMVQGTELVIVSEAAPLDATVWIYADGANIESPTNSFRLEEWDTRTPDEYYDRLVAFAESLPVINKCE